MAALRMIIERISGDLSARGLTPSVLKDYATEQSALRAMPSESRGSKSVGICEARAIRTRQNQRNTTTYGSSQPTLQSSTSESSEDLCPYVFPRALDATLIGVANGDPQKSESITLTVISKHHNADISSIQKLFAAAAAFGHHCLRGKFTSPSLLHFLLELVLTLPQVYVPSRCTRFGAGAGRESAIYPGTAHRNPRTTVALVLRA